MDFKREFSANGEWMDGIFNFPYGSKADCDKLLKDISAYRQLRKNTPKMVKENQSRLNKFVKQFQPGFFPGTTQATSIAIVVFIIFAVVFVPLLMVLCFKYLALATMVNGWRIRGVEDNLPIAAEALAERGLFNLLPRNQQ